MKKLQIITISGILLLLSLASTSCTPTTPSTPSGTFNVALYNDVFV